MPASPSPTTATFRFDPPRQTLSEELLWVLGRAFGPLPGPGEPGDDREGGGRPPDPFAAVAAARRLDLGCRIAARCPAERLDGELGPAAAAELRADRARAVAGELLLGELAREVAAAAAERALPVALLKFGALAAAGLVPRGGRRAGDLDVLAPAGRAGELGELLEARGFTAAGPPGHEHQLAPLLSPHGSVVEIHTKLLGVRPAGGASARYEDLDRAGLLAEAAALPAGCRLPAREVLAAHALVHGVAQHGHQPGVYPLSRMLADLIDLGVAAGGGGRELAGRAAALTAADVTEVEAEAVFGLCRRLAAGEAEAPSRFPGSPEARLLDHLVAGVFDPDYGAALKLRLLGRPLTDRGAAAGRLRALAAAVWLSRGQIDRVYGPPRGRLGYLGRRLARPFDLLARLGRAALAARRSRRGDPERG